MSKRSSTTEEQNHFYSEFCTRLMEAREVRGMTAAKLAKLLCMGPSTMSMYESGKLIPDRNVCTMKKLFCFSLILISALVLLTSCGTPAPTAISVDPQLALGVGGNYSLVVQYSFDKGLEQSARENAMAKQVLTFQSSNPSVATVDEKGIITAISDGTATITVAASKNVSAECIVIVTVPVTGIEMPISLSVYTNDEKVAYLGATVLPQNATDKTISYESKDKDIATVDETGKVTAVGKGTTRITATANGITRTTFVDVRVKVTGISLDSTSGWIYVGGAHELAPHVLPAEAEAVSTYQFTADNPNVATLTTTSTGKCFISGKEAGTTNITVAYQGHTATYTLTVKKAPPPKPVVKQSSGGSGTASGGSGTVVAPPVSDSVSTPNPGPDTPPLPAEPQHYHGNGSDAGVCPACGVGYSPTGGLDHGTDGDLGDLS